VIKRKEGKTILYEIEWQWKNCTIQQQRKNKLKNNTFLVFQVNDILLIMEKKFKAQ